MSIDIIARGLAGNVKKQLDDYKKNTDVTDIVEHKSDLDSYDTSKLNINDIVKVLDDETQDHKQAYYRWNGTSFDYVGGIGPYYTQEQSDERYYTKEQSDEKFALKADESTPVVPKPDPEDPSVVVPTNEELHFTVSQKVVDPETGEESYESFALSLEDLRNRILSSDTIDTDTNIEDAEIGQFVFTEIPEEEGE